MACPVCKYAKCRWIPLNPKPERIKTDRLETVIQHNIDYIDYICRDGNVSAASEERMYQDLNSYVIELEKRGRK